jgi:hypothetical protein
MSEKESTFRRVIARVRCMLPKDWLGRAGRRFRQTASELSDFSGEYIRLDSKLQQAPDLAWKALSGAAQEKYASALRSYSEEENNKLESELRRRTVKSNARQAKAEADKKESEARIAQINEMDARINLFDKLKARNAIPIWDDKGNMTVCKVSQDFDWDALQDRFLRSGKLPKLVGDAQQPGKQLTEKPSTQ